MKKKTLCLKYENQDREFLFEDKVFVIEDKKLVEDLSKPSIKNTESKLFIKSLNDTHIADVIQIKVNVNETGYFLVSFQKDGLTQEKRELLIKEISALKSNAVQSNSTQLKKAKKLVEILNKYKPIYAVFINDGGYKVNISKLSLEELKFPLLVLKKPEKKFLIRSKSDKSGTTNSYSPFSLFEVDYLFMLLFSLLCAFGTITTIFEFMNKQNIAIFLVMLAVAFGFILILAVQSTVYKKGKLINPLIRYYLILFILLGVAGGIVSGYYLSKLVFKTEIEDFDYKRLIIMSSAISSVICLSALFTSRLANRIIKKRYK